MTMLLTLTAVLLVGGTGVSWAGEDSTGATAEGLPGLSEPDTVHTNLWLTEALMGDIASHAASSLPPAPGAVLLVNKGGSEQDELFGGVATGILSGRGYDLFVVAGDSTVQSPVDFVFSYKVLGVDLTYPDIGRTLGIWQRWVAREVAVTASVEVSTVPVGKLLFKEIV